MKETITRKQRLRGLKISVDRWPAYAAAAAATVSGFCEADAGTIWYSGVVDIPVRANASESVVVGLDLPPLGTVAFAKHELFSNDVGAAYFGAYLDVAGFRQGFYLYASNLLSGGYVSQARFDLPSGYFAVMAFGNGYPNDGFKQAGEGFLGFGLAHGDPFRSRYGWARVQMDGGPSNGFTIVDYAIADRGVPIKVGQTVVPEPGSLGLLALGAVGLLAWRSVRKKQELP